MLAIFAIGENLEMGSAGKLPWDNKENLGLFHAMTWGHTLICGMKTYLPYLSGRKVLRIGKGGDILSLSQVPEGAIICGGPTLLWNAREIITHCAVTIIPQKPTRESDAFLPIGFFDNYTVQKTIKLKTIAIKTFTRNT